MPLGPERPRDPATQTGAPAALEEWIKQGNLSGHPGYEARETLSVAPVVVNSRGLLC